MDLPEGRYLNTGNWAHGSTYVLIDRGRATLHTWTAVGGTGHLRLRVLRSHDADAAESDATGRVAEVWAPNIVPALHDDDAFAALTAIEAVRAASGASARRIVRIVLIVLIEESGSPDLPEHVEAVAGATGPAR